MRIGLIVVILALPSLAWGQMPQPGTAAGGQGPAVTTPAPVPGVVPGAPAGGGPAGVPEQVAPPATASGPPDATPFSAAPSQQLPSDQSVILRRNPGGTGDAVPNLSK